MAESFGIRLRQQRERQEIALATIAERTKIKLSLLQELERDDISHWPSGIFRRAFVRSYAAAIGMDQETAVREFLAQHPDPVEVVESMPAENGEVVNSPITSGPPTRFRYFVGSLLARFRGELIDTQSHAPSIVAPVEAPWRRPAPAAEISDPPVPAPLPLDLASPLPDAAALLQVDEPLPAPVEPVVEPAPDLHAIARLCTSLGQLDEMSGIAPLIEESARLLDAVGLIVWVWNGITSELSPLLAYGYSDQVLAMVPAVRRDSDNATAAAFRSAQTCIVSGNDHASGALVVPLMASVGCIGVLAVELMNRRERETSVHALATILAAQLARLIDASRQLQAADRRFA
jgi:transcriptional regulator with XRE-family HTH domain